MRGLFAFPGPQMVQMLKPRLTAISTQRIATLALNPGATPRMRGPQWTARRGKWMRAHPLCCMCQSEGIARIADELDHVVPLSIGGADDESNYQSLCFEHHKAKTRHEAKQTQRWG